MKNIYEVLRQKELDRSRVATEVEALRVVAPLLAEDEEVCNADEDDKSTLPGSLTPPQPIRTAQPAANATPRPARAVGWEDRAKHWPYLLRQSCGRSELRSKPMLLRHFRLAREMSRERVVEDYQSAGALIV
jgi:hypothetical protein